MEAELSAVLVVSQAEDGGGSTPQGLATVSITLVLLELLQELQESDPVSKTQHTQLLQVCLLKKHSNTTTFNQRTSNFCLIQPASSGQQVTSSTIQPGNRINLVISAPASRLSPLAVEDE